MGKRTGLPVLSRPAQRYNTPTMLRRLHSFLTWTSALLLLLFSFLALHSIGRYATWSWSTADTAEAVSSSATLGVGRGQFDLNVWIHQDDGSARCTILDHISGQLPRLRDGLVSSSIAGVTIAHGALVSPTTVSYFGIMLPIWPLLILFGLLPAYALVSAIRRQADLKIKKRLINTVSLASLVLAVFIAVVWIRSYEYEYAAVPDKVFW